MGQPEQEKWWAMSAVFNRSLKAKDILDAVRVENFVPMRSVVEVCGRRRVRKSVPAIRNLIFVRTTPSCIRELKSRYLFLQYLTDIPSRSSFPTSRCVISLPWRVPTTST